MKKKEEHFSKKEEEMKKRENDVFMMTTDLKAFVEICPYDKLVMWYKGAEKSSRDKTDSTMAMVSDSISQRKNEQEAQKLREQTLGNPNEPTKTSNTICGSEMFPSAMFKQ